MGDGLDARRKRALFRSVRRGTKESDLVIGGFARAHIDEFSDAQLDRFEALLERDDPELLAWVAEVAAVPAEFDNDVMALLKDFKNTL